MFTLGCNLVFHTHCRRLTAITHVTDFGLVAERSCKLQFHMSLSLYFLESVAGDISDALQPWVAEPFSMWGGHKCTSKELYKFFMVWIGHCNITSIEIWCHHLCNTWRSKLHYFRQNYTTVKTHRLSTWNSNRLWHGRPMSTVSHGLIVRIILTK